MEGSITQMAVGSILITLVLLIVAAAVYPMIGEKVDNLTNSSHEDYVGSDTEGMVSAIPLFFWLGVLLTIIGVAFVAIKYVL